MYLIHHCLCCDSSNVRFESVYLAQFVVWRSTGKPIHCDRLISAVVCNDCGWIGSGARLDKEEIARLYKDYRGEEYNKLRIQLEPHYERVARVFNNPIKEIERRLVGINTLIDRCVNTDVVKNLLDYGGGSGHFIPDRFPNAKKYVYDISDAPLCQGVERFDVTQNQTFDFLMCCHVVEHESDPNELIQELFKFAHEDTLIYFEVPNYDLPPVPNGVFHEHQSIFNQKSMTTFLQKHRLNIIDSIQYSDYIGFLTCRQTKE